MRKSDANVDKSHGTTWWAPGALKWWIGILFAIGATCFVLGPAPGYINLVGGTYDNLTFFIGSLFFTTAAFMQYLQAANTNRKGDIKNNKKFRFLTWEPRRINWLSSVVLFIGTLFFNITTYRALQSYLTVSDINRYVWNPDVYGCICFLISSFLVWWEVSHGFWSWNPRSLSWWIVFLNLSGSVAFAVSASASQVLPLTGIPKNEFLMNFGTFIGALCFLIGAILLLKERTSKED